MKKILWFLLLGTKLFGQDNPNNLINGVFIRSQIKYHTDASCNYNQLKTTNSVAAYFTYDAKGNIKPSDFCKAGNVKFNNNPLDYENNLKYYAENEVTSDINQQNWKVSGHNTIPNMNFIYNGTLPNFDINQSLVKDTLRKSDTLFFQINNIQNADSVRITFSDNDQASNTHYAAMISPNYSNFYYVIPQVFEQLTSSTKGVIKIDAINYNYQTIAGKRYLFRNIYSYAKSNIKIVN